MKNIKKVKRTDKKKLKRYEAILEKMYIVYVKAKDKETAKKAAELFTSNSKDISTEDDRKRFGFEIENIICWENKVDEIFKNGLAIIDQPGIEEYKVVLAKIEIVHLKAKNAKTAKNVAERFTRTSIDISTEDDRKRLGFEIRAIECWICIAYEVYGMRKVYARNENTMSQ